MLLTRMPGAFQLEISNVSIFYLFLQSILTVHTLALVESKKEQLGDVFKGVSLSPSLSLMELMESSMVRQLLCVYRVTSQQ